MVWLFLLLFLVVFLAVSLVRYHLAVRAISQQIQEKIVSGSQVRLTSKMHSRSLVDLTEQIEALFGQVEKVNQVSRQEKKTLDVAISNIAHDIRTPLTIASGYTQQLAGKEELDPATLSKITDNLAQVSNRLEALLDYRRLMEGGVKPHLQEVSVSQLVMNKVFSYYDAFQKVGIELDLQVEEGILHQTDPELLERLLQNLLSNLLKHGKDAALISLKKSQGSLTLQVENKVQQSIQHLDKLTNRFYSENLSDTEESSGLGLYISQELTELLGGDFQLQTRGDRFVVTVIL